MRHTDGSRAPEPAPPSRPAIRAFSTRDLLLTTWTQRQHMAPADQVHFDFEKTSLRIAFHNARASMETASCIAFANRRDNKPEAEDEALAPVPRHVAPAMRSPGMSA